MTPLRILITNNTLGERAGSELYVRDIAQGLLRRGHKPVAYSMALGEVAREIRSLSVPVIDDLRQVGEPPDIIHGQHHFETMTALLHFSRSPAVSFCHGWFPWQEAPPIFPRVYRYVSVSEATRDRLVIENGVPESRTRIIPNFVDMARFKTRRSPPESLTKALVLSNVFHEGNGLAVIREACERMGLRLDSAGTASGRSLNQPEKVLPEYDLVFAVGRSAIEALAVGCAVVVVDVGRFGEIVTPANLEAFVRGNFGLRTVPRPLTADLICEEIGRYSAADSAAASQYIRDHSSLDSALDCLIEMYEEVIEEHKGYKRNPDAELAAAAAYLRRWGPTFKEGERFESASAELRTTRQTLAEMRATSVLAGKLHSIIYRLPREFIQGRTQQRLVGLLRRLLKP